uniref:RNA helicase n=1 Tax=Aureoumbra lagunensis TaxID=44058 RepID=A0A7S3K595_9STRA
MDAAAGRDRRAVKVARERSAHEAVDEEAIAKGIFESVVRTSDENKSWESLSLSRPLLRAVATAGYASPTPVQAAVIPIAIAGRDVCASAATGSGKTAAFVLPCLERFLAWRGGYGKNMNGLQAQIKFILLLPTRELASQCEYVLRTLGGQLRPAPVLTCLITGGTKNIRQQEAALRRRPDAIVATPGRLLDHVTNTSSFALDQIECCVLDEADKLLELGFEKEVKRLLQALPGGSKTTGILGSRSGRRQTLLFSATFGAQVETLAALSLDRPVRIKITADAAPGGVAKRLTQDFIKLKTDAEKHGARQEIAEREATFLALVSHSLIDKETSEKEKASATDKKKERRRQQMVAFFETRAQVSRMARIIQALRSLGHNEVPEALQLHGGLRQIERSANLEAFSNGDAILLLCTDVAARGLDLEQVGYVINFDMPRTVSAYVHRVGRTARAGRSGLAITIVGKARRQVLKDYLRARTADLDASVSDSTNLANTQVRNRVVTKQYVNDYKQALVSAETCIAELAEKEVLDRATDNAQLETDRAYNLVAHADEIHSRPKRTWFQSSRERDEIKSRAKEQAKDEARLADGLAIKKEARLAVGLPVRGPRGMPEGPGHRLSRKKRRRLEALQQTIDQDDDRDETEKRKKKKNTIDHQAIAADREANLAKIKRVAHKAKLTNRRKIEVDDSVPISERRTKAKHKTKFGEFQSDESTSRFKTERNTDDKNTNDDDINADPLLSSRRFTEFDPSRVSAFKKHKNKGAFKSKTRYKRR